MVPSYVFNRVFFLRIGESYATGFAINIDGKSYLITAKHFAKDISSDAEILVYHDEQWKTLNVRLVAHAPGEIDITVLAPPFSMTLGLALAADMGGLTYGQDVYFLGYPYGWSGHIGELNWKYPMPFIKKAIVSCVEQDESGVKRVYLDGHNNPGFSGGPVVFQQRGIDSFKIASVISEYRYVDAPIFHEGAKLPLSYQYNTGIILSYSIQHACELARSNPLGPEVVI